MRLKSFTAKTLTDAMRLVRDALGEDAIIVATREEAGGVKVTAALDSFHAAPDAPLPGRFARVMAEELGPDPGTEFVPETASGLQPIQPDIFEKSFADSRVADDAESYALDLDRTILIDIVTDALLRHNTPAPVTNAIIGNAMDSGAETAKDLLSSALAGAFDFSPLVQEPLLRPLMMVGPPGAGKTLCTAKLAARAVLGGLTPLVISADTYRAGAREQLDSLTAILQVDLLEADCAENLAILVREHENHVDQILIDTGGLNPFDRDEMRALAALVNAVDAEPLLVIPAGGDSEETAEIACTYELLGVERMIPTRLDMTRRLGGVLNAAYKARLQFADASNTPQVADGLIPLSAPVLSRLILPEDTQNHNNNNDNGSL